MGDRLLRHLEERHLLYTHAHTHRSVDFSSPLAAVRLRAGRAQEEDGLQKGSESYEFWNRMFR